MYKKIFERLGEFEERLGSNGGNGNGNHGTCLDIGSAVRRLRQERGQRAVQIAKSAGMDPRTFAAIEAGRIKNPSLGNLASIAHALGISIAQVFLNAESGDECGIYFGNQKGEYTCEFAELGFRLISFTPMIRDFFIGKMVLGGRAEVKFESFASSHQIFFQIMMGNLFLTVGGKGFHAKEGDHLLFNGLLPYSLTNDSIKECSFLLVTAPSFLVSFQKAQEAGKERGSL